MRILKRIVVFACVCMVCRCVKADTSGETQQADTDAALDTIAIINHINYAVEVIRTYNNVIALEDEYERISADNLNLNCIRDEESLQLIRDILNTLNNMRMNDRARKWYRHVLTRNLKAAKLDGMAKMATTVTSSLVNGSGGFWSRLGQVVTATALVGVESVADYKKAEHALQGQLEDKQFELDTEKLNELHKMNDMLLARQWNLINKYRLDDRLRVTGKEVRVLVRCLKGSDRKNTFRQLKPMRRVFEVYPTYWYYRAAMAIAISDYKDAFASCEHFEKINRGLFRTDQMAANVAMIKITAMLGQRPVAKALEPKEREMIENDLETICGQNYSSENADQSIFCTSVYLSVLDDVDTASSVLESLMAKLSADSQDELKEYCDLFVGPNEKKVETPPNMVYLVQCRMLRIAIDQRQERKIHIERLKEICGRETTCSLEKLFYFGALRIEDLWEIAKRDVAKINMYTAGDCIVVEIPVTWFLLGNVDVSMELLNGDKSLLWVNEADGCRSHVMSRSYSDANSRNMAYVKVTAPIEGNAVEKCDAVRLKLKHISWPVDVLFVPLKLSHNGNRRFLPSQAERFMGKVIAREILPANSLLLEKSIDELTMLAEQGNADAQYQIAMRYAKGVGCEKSEAKAAIWCRKAAELGHVAAQCDFGVMLSAGSGVVKDEVEAVKWYRKSAEQGYAMGQNNLGVMYENGSGVGKSETEAAKWYLKAAEQGYALAQNNLGSLYANGRGVAKDEVVAVRWFRKAAEQKCVLAQVNLGAMYARGRGVEKDEVEAARWYNIAVKQTRTLAEIGDAEAQYALAVFFAKGVLTEQNNNEAVIWLRKAAEQGHVAAQYELFIFLANGIGTKDKPDAMKWLRSSAEHGYARAQLHLGLMYAEGEGVKKDKVEAVRWYRKAAEQDDPDASVVLAEAYKNGEGVKRNKLESDKWYCKAARRLHEVAEQGGVDAQYSLGCMYADGVGVSKDEIEAEKWFLKAADQGHAKAKIRLEEIENSRRKKKWTLW